LLKVKQKACQAAIDIEFRGNLAWRGGLPAFIRDKNIGLVQQLG
jgi:hypothetical protein